jgi:hypothetical protein
VTRRPNPKEFNLNFSAVKTSNHAQQNVNLESYGGENLDIIPVLATLGMLLEHEWIKLQPKSTKRL